MTPAWAQRQAALRSDCIVSPDVFDHMVDQASIIASATLYLWVVSPPVCATGVSLIARGCLLGATPRSQPWTSAVTLPQGRNGLNVRRMAVW